MTANHIMIDCETLGTTPGSAILTIGAVRFDPHGADDPRQGLDPAEGQLFPLDRAFYARIDRASCAALGLTEDPATLGWWQEVERTPEARHEAFDATPREDIADALGDLALWIANGPIAEDIYVWSHGAGFDIVLLEEAYRRVQLCLPWSFPCIRDTRTLYDLADIRPERDRRTHHHALHDAAAQAEAVQRAYAKLNPPRRD